MARQTRQLIGTLKRALKTHGKTYADVAAVLGLSEASIKRLLTSDQLSLARLEEICQMLDMDLTELFRQMADNDGQLQRLSAEQEREIASDLLLLLVTVCVLNRWTMQEIIDFYHIDQNTCIQKLAHLDRLNIIELLPKNKIKLKIAPNFSWLESGPIQQFFQQRIASEYFASTFKGEGECLLVLNGMLSKASNQEFQRKMKRLAREFEALNREDVGLGLSNRHGSTVVIAMRDWNYGLFKPLLK